MRPRISAFLFCLVEILHNNIFTYSLNIYLVFVFSLSPAKRHFQWLHSPVRETSEIFPRVSHECFQIQIISLFPFAHGGEMGYRSCQLYICVFPGSSSSGLPRAHSPLWYLLELGAAETIVSKAYPQQKFCSLESLVGRIKIEFIPYQMRKWLNFPQDPSTATWQLLIIERSQNFRLAHFLKMS